jgi:hypothetical protein
MILAFLNRKYILVIVFSLLSSDTFSRVGPYSLWAVNNLPKEFTVNLDGQYFETVGFYDREGGESDISDNNSFNEKDLEAKLVYGINKDFEAGIFFRGREVVSKTGDTELTNNGLESYGVLAKYSFKPQKKWHYSAEVSYRNTAYTNSNFEAGAAPNNEVVLGDSGNEFHLQLKVGRYLSKNLALNTRGGFKIPPNDLSNEITYGAELALQFSVLALLGGVDGVYSLNTDRFSDNVENKPSQNTGQTSLYNSINREFSNAYLGISHGQGRYRMSLVGGQRLRGYSTDKGNFFKLGIIWSSGGVKKSKELVNRFKDYDIEATVIKISPRAKFIKIDQGLGQDIYKGMRFDIYQTDFFGGNEIVASGRAHDVGADWSIIKIVQRYKDVAIKKDFIARGR